VLAVVDEEFGLRALRQRVLARVRVGRPLRHPLSRSLSCCDGRRTGTAPGARRICLPTDGDVEHGCARRCNRVGICIVVDKT
jgi:hypothetical protein